MSLQRLNALIGEVMDLRHSAALVGWDERVCMPRGGVPVHGEMIATIGRIAHEKFTSDEVGRALEDAARETESLAPDADSRRLVRVTSRDYLRAVRVPGEYVAEHALVTSAAHQAWKEAREQSHFAIFRPHLEKIVALQQRYVGFFEPVAHPYDAIVEAYEPGVRTADIQAMFDALRSRQVALTRAIGQRPRPVAAFLTLQVLRAGHARVRVGGDYDIWLRLDARPDRQVRPPICHSNRHGRCANHHAIR